MDTVSPGSFSEVGLLLSCFDPSHNHHKNEPDTPEQVMTEEEMLFAAIRANPDEDTPRLAYADWLDEHLGNQAPAPLRPTTRPLKVPAATASERAEYIRVACELARLENDAPSPVGKTRLKELLARKRALETAVTRAWETPFRYAKPFGGRSDGFKFHRGLPNQGSLSDHGALNYGEALLRQSPVLEFDLYGVAADRLTRLLAAPWLRSLPRLSIAGTRSRPQEQPPDLGQFADSPNLVNLTFLQIEGRWSVTPAGADRLARSEALPKLRCLRLRSPESDSAGFPRLFDGPTFRQLTELWLAHLPLHEGELAAIFGSDTLSAMETLFVRQRGIGRAEGEALAHSSMWPTLRSLLLGTVSDSGHSDPTPSGWLREFSAALESAAPGRLESLDLGFCRLGDSEATSLARWPIWHSLRELHLTANDEITARAWGGVIRATSAGRMQELNLGWSTVDDQIAKSLADAPHMVELRTLSLHHTQVTDAGALALAESPYLGQLRSLGLQGCRIDDATQKKLKKRFGNGVKCSKPWNQT